MNVAIRTEQRPSIALRVIVALVMFIYFEVGYINSAQGVEEYAVNGAIFIDALIPQIPAFIVFYMLGYVFVFSPCFTLKSRTDFYWGTTLFFLILSVSFLIFQHFPVVMEKTIATSNDALSTLTRFQQQADTKYNNFPSLHVSLNLFAFLVFCHNAKKWFWLTLPIPLLIIASTLLVKQHLLIDVVGGIAMAVAAFQFFKYATSHWQTLARSAFILTMLVTLLIVGLNAQLLIKIYHIVVMFASQAVNNIPNEVILLGIVVTILWLVLLKRTSR